MNSGYVHVCPDNANANDWNDPKWWYPYPYGYDPPATWTFTWSGPSYKVGIDKVENGYVVTHDGKRYVCQNMKALMKLLEDLFGDS